MTTPVPLPDWLTELKTRNVQIRLDPTGHPQLHGPATPTDHQLLNRHLHALTIAAHRSHSPWWDVVLDHGQGRLTLDDIPVSPHDPDAFACATCARPAHRLDHHLLPWCPDHFEDQP